MKKFPLFLSMLLLNSGAEELSADELGHLLSKVEDIEERTLSHNLNTQRNAISAFRSAMTSEVKAYQLYQDSLQKIALEKQKKKGEDVRSLLRKEKEKVTNAERRAVQHQLYWLVASMEAAGNPDLNRSASTKKLVEGMANIVNDADSLTEKAVEKWLTSNPYSSVFAKAFNVEHLKPKDWPSSPLDYDGLYKEIICKELINSGKFDEARTQWAQRIKAERVIIATYAKKPDSTKFGDLPVALEKYENDKIPKLMWDMETALYDAGDKRAALTQLFGIFESNPLHKSHASWVSWLKSALAPAEEEISE